jgi:hypothetical protein
MAKCTGFAVVDLTMWRRVAVGVMPEGFISSLNIFGNRNKVRIYPFFPLAMTHSLTAGTSSRPPELPNAHLTSTGPVPRKWRRHMVQ